MHEHLPEKQFPFPEQLLGQFEVELELYFSQRGPENPVLQVQVPSLQTPEFKQVIPLQVSGCFTSQYLPVHPVEHLQVPFSQTPLLTQTIPLQGSTGGGGMLHSSPVHPFLQIHLPWKHAPLSPHRKDTQASILNPQLEPFFMEKR